MAGRRLLDVAKLINASRSIAKQHVALRSQQFEVFNKTSSLAKAVKSQTDRVTLTAQAAVALVKRLNETENLHTSDGPTNSKYQTGSLISRQESAQHEPARVTERQEGIRQDHHHGPSERHSASPSTADQELEVRQEKPARHPLPEGTIPHEGAKVDLHSFGRDSYAQRPYPEPNKRPLEKENSPEEGLRPISSAQSSIPDPGRDGHSPADKRSLQRQSEAQIPSVTASAVEKASDEIDKDVFYERPTSLNTNFSSLPRSKIPKHAELGKDEQRSQINADTYSNPQLEQDAGKVLEQEAGPKGESVPEGVDVNVFRTARVSKMLGENPYKRSEVGEGSSRGNSTAQEQPASHVESSAPVGEQPLPSHEPTISDKSENAMRQLGADLARDADSTLSPEVRFGATVHRGRYLQLTLTA